jgi:cytosine deaminase
MERHFEIAKQAAELAFSAMRKGTFGVGGLIIHNPTLEILHTQENRVIFDGQVNDPTAHVERQTVDWYYSELAAGRPLPKPEDLTIVSSLDPCMMCTGSILSGGFNVVSLGLDDFAGVDFNGKYEFKTLPPELAAKAAKSFSYFGVQGERPYQGFEADIFKGIHLTKNITDMAATAFAQSLDGTKAIVSKGDRATVDCDVADLKHKYADYGVCSFATALDSDFDILEQSANNAYALGSKFDSALLKLPNGERLMVRGSNSQLSPIQTPVIRLIRDYTALQNQVRTEGHGELPHIKYCQIVMLKGPGREAEDIATLGAYGSAMEGPIPASNPDSLVFYGAKQTKEELDDMIAQFPPLYTQVIGLKPRRLGL